MVDDDVTTGKNRNEIVAEKKFAVPGSTSAGAAPGVMSNIATLCRLIN